MSESPPQAVLCDYGKAIRADKATESKIGPIPFLAPEVGEPNVYTSKIDIWGIGLVCCSILFPKAIYNLSTEGKRPDTSWWAMMLTKLSTYAEKGKQQKSFASLIEGMLYWRHQERYTVVVSMISFTHSPLESWTYLMSFWIPISIDSTLSLI